MPAEDRECWKKVKAELRLDPIQSAPICRCEDRPTGKLGSWGTEAGPGVHHLGCQ